ncbi:helix-turn-helix domain-containing protein [Intrasporangium mesophilum]
MRDAFGAGPDAFANAVRHIRKAHGLSQRELASRLGIPRSGLARIETSVLRLPVESAVSLFRVMGFDVGLQHVFPCPPRDARPPGCSDWFNDGAVGNVDLAGRAFPAHGHLQIGQLPTWWGARYGWGSNARNNTWWSHYP